MAAEAPRWLRWVALEVADGARYAAYRAAMTPILASYGGRFEHDFAVSRVFASSAGDRVNRVFAMSFPDREAGAKFLDDARYRGIRKELFEPAVASTALLAEYAAPG